MAMVTLIALRMDSLVITCLAVIPFNTRSTMARPAWKEERRRSPYGAGIKALPGRLMPNASDTQHIELAVPRNEQEPQLGQAVFSSALYSHSSILPAAHIPFASSIEVRSDLRPSNSIPPSIGPPTQTMAGISSLAAAISIPGTILSQEARRTIPSNRCACTITSIELQIISRDGKM